MSALLGIDSGISSVKVMVCWLETAIQSLGNAEYPILTPQPCHADCPAEWWRAPIIPVRQALQQAAAAEILGIGFSDPMHGFVPMEADTKPRRPAIIWTDQRSAALLAEIRERIATELLATTCGTAPAGGFLISALFWLRKHEPEALERTVTLLTPKGYVRFRLTDELSTDESDAAAREICMLESVFWSMN
jgi:xylulokinase